MDGHTRRENLRQRLQGAKTPISGAVLAAAFQVSRQVIVQDIALLRAQDVPVISTNRGYLILGEACRVHRFKVRHDLSRMEEELNIFVDAGATVRNVTIDHPVYGTLPSGPIRKLPCPISLAASITIPWKLPVGRPSMRLKRP